MNKIGLFKTSSLFRYLRFKIYTFKIPYSEQKLLLYNLTVELDLERDCTHVYSQTLDWIEVSALCSDRNFDNVLIFCAETATENSEGKQTHKFLCRLIRTYASLSVSEKNKT